MYNFFTKTIQNVTFTKKLHVYRKEGEIVRETPIYHLQDRVKEKRASKRKLTRCQIVGTINT